MNLKAIWGGFLKFLIEKIRSRANSDRKNYTWGRSETSLTKNTVPKPGHLKLKAEPYFIENREKQIKKVLNNTYEVWKRFKDIEDLK